jgi:nicotinamidase-related amidase
VLLIDVINPMDFEGADALLPRATKAAPNIARLKRRAHEADVPVVYVNDNFDCWHLGFRELVDKFRAGNVPGLPIIRLVEPDLGSDYYILKPRHSCFFHTALEVLLLRLETRVLITTGFATDICVLFTATDAYMRGFSVVVPPDCVAAEREADNEHALRQMARLLKAEVVPSERIDFERLTRSSRGRIPRP